MAAKTIEEVNSLGYEDFLDHFGSVIERTPLVAASVWSSRPFHSVQSLHEAFCSFISELPASGKTGLLRCHPDLAGRLSQQSALSRESTKEQKSAGLLELTQSERQELNVLNTQYKQKFSFPFVVCARENKKEAIFHGIRARLGNTVEVEVEAGVGEVCKIAWYRLVDLVQENDSSNPKL